MLDIPYTAGRFAGRCTGRSAGHSARRSARRYAERYDGRIREYWVYEWGTSLGMARPAVDDREKRGKRARGEHIQSTVVLRPSTRLILRTA